jgi:hypothetical protein
MPREKRRRAFRFLMTTKSSLTNNYQSWRNKKLREKKRLESRRLIFNSKIYQEVMEETYLEIIRVLGERKCCLI